MRMFYGTWPVDRVGNPIKVKVVTQSSVTGKPITKPLVRAPKGVGIGARRESLGGRATEVQAKPKPKPRPRPKPKPGY